MLDIPELSDLICGQLGRHDLVQCAQVSKKWHALVIPHLWRDLSWINEELILSTVASAFLRIVQEDYLAEQGYRELYDVKQSTRAQPSRPMSALSKSGHRARLLQNPNNESTRAPPSHPLPALSKYGHCIRLLPNPYSFSQPQAHLRHLLKRCSPDVQVKYFSMDIADMDLDPGHPKKAIVDFTVPRVRSLHVFAVETPPPSSVSKFMDLLDQRSIALERLELVVYISNMRRTDAMGEPMENGPKTCRTLKELVFIQFEYNAGAEGFWSLLLGRCGRVKKVQVLECIGPVQSLAQGMVAHMPHLDEIRLGDDGDVVNKPDDAAMAALLSGSRKGWKVVRLRSEFGTTTIDALSKHSSTLMLLDIWKCDGTLSEDLARMLSSCANLHALVSTNFDAEDSSVCAEIDFKAFIDLDPDTGAPKPWKCEAFLKELKVIITGIPRPDMEGEDAVEEAYPGEGRETQGRVYDRLARFTNLKTLWLGDDESIYYIWSLEMSLESGLGKLSGLKKLREVSVLRTETRIGLEEAQWMTANWPRLRAIYGVWDDEASAWLQENTAINVVRW